MVSYILVRARLLIRTGVTLDVLLSVTLDDRDGFGESILLLLLLFQRLDVQHSSELPGQ